MLCELLAGTHPVYRWADAHPYAALGVLAVCALLAMARW